MHLPSSARSLSILLLLISLHARAETHKEFHYTAGSGSSISVFNNIGSITVRSGSGRQVGIAATLQSDKVEVDCRQTGNRIDVRTHNVQKASAKDARVDYEIAVPADTNVTIDAAEGRIQVENLRGDVNIDSESANVELRGLSGPGVHVQTVNGNITLADVRQARVQLTSTGGNIQLNSVNGPLVSAKSTSGSIRYSGDFSGDGRYSFANHTGDIEVDLPASASVDLSARSIKGSVENDFPFMKADHPPFPLAEGRAFAGTVNKGGSSVELRSFSGKIRVKKL
jgi:DUF4097 and DUF4098 domain-containing protein YvlB